MKTELFRFLKIISLFTLVLLILHYAVFHYFFNINLYYPIWFIYLFNVLVTLLIYLLLVFVHQNFSDKTGFTFMGTGLIKMLAAVLFLLPAIVNAKENMFENIMSFFVPYFLYLLLETLFAVRLINEK